MTSPTTEWTDVLKRLERLERQNRRLKQIGASALAVIAALVLMGQAPATRIVEANAFVLKDAEGKMRGRLSMTENAVPELILFDASGTDRIRLGVHPFLGSTLSFYSASGKSGPLKDGLKADLNEMGLAIFDDEGFETRIGSTDLVTPLTGETHKTSAASVIFFDKDKKVLWQAP